MHESSSPIHAVYAPLMMLYANQNGFFVKELTFSPIKGPEGNIEFLIVITKNEQDNLIGEEQVDMVVNEAKKHLGE